MHSRKFNIKWTDWVVIFYAFLAILNFNSGSIESLQKQILLSETTSLNKNQVQYGIKRAEIALKEYASGVSEDYKGCNCGPRVDDYTHGLAKQWCAMFASWVFNQAGNPLTSPDSSVSWRFTKAREIGKFLEENAVWYSKDDVLKNRIQPQVGDVMIFWRGSFEENLGHADIVVSVDPNKFGIASLVGGNLNDKVTLREDYHFAEHYGFLGFGRLENDVQINKTSSVISENNSSLKELLSLQTTKPESSLEKLIKK